MTSTLHALWSSAWWTLGTMLSPVSGVANANGERTPQDLRLNASFGSQHSNENSKYASDIKRFRRRKWARDSRYTAVDERLAGIRIKAKYFDISVICAHAPTEDKDNTAKDAFYDKLEVVYNRCPRSVIKMLVGDIKTSYQKGSYDFFYSLWE